MGCLLDLSSARPRELRGCVRLVHVDARSIENLPRGLRFA
jgi:hypothetical protein